MVPLWIYGITLGCCLSSFSVAIMNTWAGVIYKEKGFILARGSGVEEVQDELATSDWPLVRTLCCFITCWEMEEERDKIQGTALLYNSLPSTLWRINSVLLRAALIPLMTWSPLKGPPPLDTGTLAIKF